MTAASPNGDIDKAIKKMMATIDDKMPPDVAVKIINSAVNWEKVKRGLKDDENPFDPDSM